MGPLYAKLLPRTLEKSIQNTRTSNAAGVIALHLDFVAKPEGARSLQRELASVLEDAGLVREGLQSGLLLVSDREARLVTLLTFWDAQLFATGRARRITWMQKLLLPFADGPVRAQTSAPHFVLRKPTADLEDERTLPVGSEEFAGITG